MKCRHTEDREITSELVWIYGEKKEEEKKGQ